MVIVPDELEEELEPVYQKSSLRKKNLSQSARHKSLFPVSNVMVSPSNVPPTDYFNPGTKQLSTGISIGTKETGLDQ